MMQKKIELLRKTGHIHQVADVTPIEYREGRADKLSAWQVKKRSIIFYCHAGKGNGSFRTVLQGDKFQFSLQTGAAGSKSV